MVLKGKHIRGRYRITYHLQQEDLQRVYVGNLGKLSVRQLNTTIDVLRCSDAPCADYTVLPPCQGFFFSQAFPIPHELSKTPPDLVPPPPLPVPLTPLIGRERDTAAVVTLLRSPDVRLVSLIGMGGIGKTRLALSVATDVREDFADGVYFVPLAPARDPQQMLSALVQNLGLNEDGNCSAVDLLKRSLYPRQLLLVLDNLEQAMLAAPMLADLLIACPGLKLLVTSQAVLHLNGEHHFPVTSLPFPDPAHLPPLDELSQYPAVELFIQRAQAIVSDLPLNPENLRTIAEISARLEGLPLAIELAAARVKLHPPQVLLPLLSCCLDVLTLGGLDRPARQQTLRATCAWSYDLLTTDEQRVFRRLAVFARGCSFDAAEKICMIFGDVTTSFLDVVASLIDTSLLFPVNPSALQLRLRLPEIMREYARETLTASGELERIQEAHASYYQSFAEQAEPKLYRSERDRWLAQLEQDEPNLCAALDFLCSHHDWERALRLAGALGWLWYLRGCLSEGLDRIEQNVRAADAGGIVIACLEGMADVAARQGKASWAAQLWGAGQRQRESTDTHNHPTEPAQRKQLMERARKSLGAKGFDEAWARGRSMSSEKVLSAEDVASAEPARTMPTAPRPAGLTRRELEVLLLVAAGLSNTEIADRLVITLATVISYLNCIYKKLGVCSRTAAMRYAIDHHLCQ